MVEPAEESKGAAQQPAAAQEEEKTYLCEKDGRDHGHSVENSSWRSVMMDIGHRGEIASSQLADALGPQQ